MEGVRLSEADMNTYAFLRLSVECTSRRFVVNHLSSVLSIFAVVVVVNINAMMYDDLIA